MNQSRCRFSGFIIVRRTFTVRVKPASLNDRSNVGDDAGMLTTARATEATCDFRVNDSHLTEGIFLSSRSSSCNIFTFITWLSEILNNLSSVKSEL